MATTAVHGKLSKLTPGQAAAIQNELDAILNSGQFSGTKRGSDFLQFVVTKALVGDYESLTERALGIELFGRPVDYETGSDAIVRVRANDVRRRLTQFYSEHQRVSQVIVNLPSGSYIPEFHWSSSSEAPTTPTNTADPAHSSVAESATSPGAALDPRRAAARNRLMKPILAAAALLVTVSAGLILFTRNSASPDHALKEFWQPLIQERSPVIVCFGNAVSFWPSQSVRQAIEDGDLALSANPGPLVETRDDTVTVGNLRAAVSILNVLRSYGISNELRWPQEVQSTDLDRSNVIFVGAFNNPWSMSLNRDLRFSFKQFHSESNFIWMIQDRTSPNQNWSITKAYPERSDVDYALITRIIDHEGKRVVISVGGLSQFGTQAAGEFLTNEAALNAFAAVLPEVGNIAMFRSYCRWELTEGKS